MRNAIGPKYTSARFANYATRRISPMRHWQQQQQQQQRVHLSRGGDDAQRRV